MNIEHDTMPDREEIQQETSAKVLLDWHENAVDLYDNLKAQVAAHNLFDDHSSDDVDWAIRAKSKAGFVGASLRRIERRMVEIGLELPLTMDRKERQRIRHLEGVASFLQRLCDKNGIEHNTAPVVRTKSEEV